MKYGVELISDLEQEISALRASISERMDRIEAGFTDLDDCFVSQRVEERGISTAEEKIRLIRDGGTAWFYEYATLDGVLLNAKWCNTRYGTKLRIQMPDGDVVWTESTTKRGLARRGVKMVRCRRPAWYKFHSSNSGMLGVYTGEYILFPSDVNYATGEPADAEPLEIADAE